MKLFTKDIDKKLFQQYQNGSDLDSQVAVAKIFNPYGNGRWFLLNSDPQDPDYLWAIVQMGDVVEVGSVLRSELESVRVSPFKFPLERDLGFTMVNAGELYRGLQEGKFYQKGGSLMAARGMEVGRYYKDKNGETYRYIGENSQRQTLFNDGQKVIVKSIDDFDEEPKNKKLFGIFEDGGMMADGDKINDFFEKQRRDIINRSPFQIEVRNFDCAKKIKNKNNQVEIIKLVNPRVKQPISYVLVIKNWANVDELKNIFIECSNHIISYGFTSDYQIDIYREMALRDEKMATNIMADGGFVDKTDEELKGMTDDELFEYLDAKAAYMKQYTKPLSSFKAKNYAANSVAIQFQNEGTDKLDANFPSLSKINEQATKDYQETISKKSDKMAEGGSTQNDWYEKFNAGFEDLLKKGYINDAEYKFLEKWLQNYDPLDDYGNMGGRAAAKKYVDDNRRYVEMAKGGMMEHGLRIGDKVTTDMFWDNKIVVENVKTRKRAEIDLDNGKRKDEMAMGGEISKESVLGFKDWFKYDGATYTTYQYKDNTISPIYYEKYTKKYDLGSKRGHGEKYKTLKEAKVAAYDEAKFGKMDMGGKVKFQDKVKAIKASLLKTKKVPKKVQKDYGKTYNAKEAELAAKRIAGAMAKKGMK